MTSKTKKPVERQTIEAIRNDNNKLIVKCNPQWPAMYKIHRQEGGAPPAELSGQYTSAAIAEKAILTHLG